MYGTFWGLLLRFTVITFVERICIRKCIHNINIDLWSDYIILIYVIRHWYPNILRSMQH